MPPRIGAPATFLLCVRLAVLVNSAFDFFESIFDRFFIINSSKKYFVLTAENTAT